MLNRLANLNIVARLTTKATLGTNNIACVSVRAMSTGNNNDNIPDSRVENVVRAVTEEFQVANEEDEYPFLDPLNPPRLTYEHVKLIKNIDYSPIIRRARDRGMFTVDDVIKIVNEVGQGESFKSTMDPDHKQDPFVFNETFDVFNKGQKKCPLCLPDPTQERVNRIHYTNVNLLRRYINSQGMILSRQVTGTCRKHQNMLRSAIKNARILALLSPTSKWFVPLSYVYPEKYDGRDQALGTTLEALERNRMFEEFEKYGPTDPDIRSFDDFVRDFNENVEETLSEKEATEMYQAATAEAKAKAAAENN